MMKIVLVIPLVVLIFVSGCVQEETPGLGAIECESEEDCPDRTCFAKDCVNNNCSYSEIIPCCGNGICEAEETYSICPQDCPKTTKDSLEEAVPGINDYPQLEQVFIDLYVYDGFNESEATYIESMFDIFKSKTELHQADEEVLAYLVTNTIEPNMDLSKIYATDVGYFVEEVIPLANDITEGSFGEMESISKIVLWVRENIKKNETAAIGVDDTVEAILETRETPTTCDYYATLITAFCRAIGIPAREVGGNWDVLSSGHAWTEAYVNGEWVIVDSTGALDPEKKNWLFSVNVYDPLNDRLMDVSLSYNTDILDFIVEHTKEVVGENDATEQAEEILSQYKEESDLANKYAYAQDIMNICISEIIAEQEGHEPSYIKVLNLWDWDELIKQEAFLSELERAEAISVYDVTSGGSIRYMGTSASEFPLEKINTLIPEIEQHFQGEIYFFFVHYKAHSGPLSEAVAINVFDPEDVEALQAGYHDLVTGTPDLLKNLVIEIADVVSEEKDSTSFHLPKELQEGTEYSIITTGFWGRENTDAWNIVFNIQNVIEIQDIVLTFEADQTSVMVNIQDHAEQEKYSRWSNFENLKLIDNEGEVIVEPPYEDCPGGIRIEPDQTLEIYSEDDVVVIKGDMSTE